MDLLLLALLLSTGGYAVNAQQQRKRIALLGAHLGNYQIEKLLETLTQGYLRALGEQVERAGGGVGEGHGATVSVGRRPRGLGSAG